MNILQLAFFPPPYGGVSVFVDRLVDSLNASGFNARSYTTTIGKNEDSRSVGLLPNMKLVALPATVLSLVNASKGFDVIHSHFGIECTVHLLFVKLINPRIKVVITFHDKLSIKNWFHVSWIKRLAFRLLVKYFECSVIAVSREISDSLTYRIAGLTAVIVPAYIPINEIGSVVDSCNDQVFELCKKFNKIVYFYSNAFRMESGKEVYGVSEAIIAFSIVNKVRKDVCMLMCLNTQENNLNIIELKKSIEQLGLSQHVFFQVKPVRDMSIVWKNVDMYIRPTSTDGDSVAIREALSYGLTVVASSVVARPEGTIVYNYGDRVTLANLILENINNKRKQFTNEDTVQRLIEFYSNLFAVRR